MASWVRKSPTKVPGNREPTNSTNHSPMPMAMARMAATTWLRVKLEIRVPSGEVETHVTDGNGMIRIDDLEPGTCDILAMDDAEAYEVVGVE